jgi:hypothetical protein
LPGFFMRCRVAMHCRQKHYSFSEVVLSTGRQPASVTWYADCRWPL